MKLIPMIVICAITFGICFLVDKLFHKLFRAKVQHASGLSVKLNKRYATIGIILFFVGVCAIIAGINGQMILIICGPIVLLMGIALIVYYLTFGIYYDEDSFVVSKFGKRSVIYRYNQIAGQLLYNASGNVLIELHLKDGGSVNLQATMTGAYAFLDYAFKNWCRQTGTDPESCDFHDPQNSLWFPMMEG